MSRTDQAGGVGTRTGPGGDPETQRSAPPAAMAVRVRGLRKSYGRTVALDGVDLDVPAGSVLGLLGPNGAGKTTLVRVLLGLARASAGTVRLLDEPMPARAAAALPRVGALVEGPGFLPHLSGHANLVRLAAAEPALAGTRVSNAVDAALARVGLGPAPGITDRPYRHYSRGTAQRLALAAVLLAPRELVVLDEPTTGLDPAGIRLVRHVITQLHTEGATVVVASPAVHEVERTCTHVAVLAAGMVVATGELPALLAADAPSLSVCTPQPSAALAALRAARIPAYREHSAVVAELAGTSAEDVVRTLVQAGVPVAEARRRHTALEELFVRLTEEA